MNWAEIEQAFSRAALLAFSKRKALLTFPVLFLCGVLTVFCRAVAFGSGAWIAMSLAFLPILLSSSLLLGLGVLLIRIHLHEVKNLRLGFDRLFAGSIDLVLGTAYIAIPPVLIYLLLWMVLGVFSILGQIPGVGIILAFGPFLLIFGSILLCLFNFAMLFFVAPAAAMQPLRRTSLVKRVALAFQGKMLSSLALFLLALIPISIVAGLLSLSAVLTGVQIGSEQTLAIAMEWFFIMIPFCALLTPFVVFFFNFAVESYQLLQPKPA